jgi:hypothetical protein
MSVGARTFKRLVRDPEFHLKITRGFGYNTENKRHLNARAQHLHTQKPARQVSLNVTSMPTVVETFKEFFINEFHKDKLYTSMTTVAHCGVCRKIYSEMT